MNYNKQKMAYPHVYHVSMLWALVDMFLMKWLSSQEIVFFTDYFTRDKNGFVHYRIQEISINNFRTGALCRIFKYSTEHLKVTGNL